MALISHLMISLGWLSFEMLRPSISPKASNWISATVCGPSILRRSISEQRGVNGLAVSRPTKSRKATYGSIAKRSSKTAPVLDQENEDLKSAVWQWFLSLFLVGFHYDRGYLLTGARVGKPDIRQFTGIERYYVSYRAKALQLTRTTFAVHSISALDSG